MKAITFLALATVSFALSACQNPSAASHDAPAVHNAARGSTSGGRPFNAMTREFEDPTTPGHKTSPGDAR